MSRLYILTGTITYALQGREMLRKNGFSAELKRQPGGLERVGCGYGISTVGNDQQIETLLRQSGVKIIEIQRT